MSILLYLLLVILDSGLQAVVAKIPGEITATGGIHEGLSVQASVSVIFYEENEEISASGEATSTALHGEGE